MHCLCTVENCRFIGLHCVCTVPLFDETSKNILTFGVAADGFEWQGSQYFLFLGPFTSSVAGDLAFFMLLEGVFFDIYLL